MRVVLSLFLLSLLGTAVADDEVRLYTNADLEKFGPPPDAMTRVVQDDDRGWEFVTAFLERERARLDADRAYELNWRRLDLEEQVLDRRDRSLYLSPYVSYPYFPHSTRHAGRRHGSGVSHMGSARPDGIRPLHAGPTAALQHRSRAIRNSGADAFPRRSRSR